MLKNGNVDIAKPATPQRAVKTPQQITGKLVKEFEGMSLNQQKKIINETAHSCKLLKPKINTKRKSITTKDVARKIRR
ncbi:hypothetical protein EB796_020188 [Bugula neritina]|uniref:Uncharacterized protein n=1 Tax=Bugula neritina TaxID=10212 RepID=A0A7J7J5R0_BUGNE|nr:hypothetical protein EB796_020188 [Bugula neritina]